jgi:hypothetical protein
LDGERERIPQAEHPGRTIFARGLSGPFGK